MSAYEIGHLALMRGFLGIFLLLVGALILAGLAALYCCIARARDGHEDQAGWHLEDRP